MNYNIVRISAVAVALLTSGPVLAQTAVDPQPVVQEDGFDWGWLGLLGLIGLAGLRGRQRDHRDHTVGTTTSHR